MAAEGGNEAAIDAAFAEATFKTYKMKVRVKAETYQDELRTKCSASSAWRPWTSSRSASASCTRSRRCAREPFGERGGRGAPRRGAGEVQNGSQGEHGLPPPC